MTFTEIVNAVASRLNLTSTDALTRIGVEVNERYKWMASSIGFDTIERGVTVATTVIGSAYVTFGGGGMGEDSVTKLLSVFNTNITGVDNPQVLSQVSFDELRNQPVLTGDQPRQYAVSLMGSESVQVMLDTKAETAYDLNADAMINLATLSGADVPAFALDYHNALIYGAMATELDKMEKYDLSAKKEAQFEGRVSDLRMYIAKSAYLRIYQNRRGYRTIRSVPLVS